MTVIYTISWVEFEIKEKPVTCITVQNHSKKQTEYDYLCSLYL